jgi:tetratricopeptide (TPR) repeat protein
MGLVESGVRATAETARQLFEARHFPGVVALVSDALDDAPDCIPLLLLRARSHIALRRDLPAQTDLREIIRLDPQCGVAYRLIGELAARRDENESAAIFFREALRLDPDDIEAADWLQIVETSVRPAAVANKLPAPAAAAGRFPPSGARTWDPSPPPSTRPRSRPESQPRFAKGTQTPDEERATVPFRGKSPKTPRMASGSSPRLATIEDPTTAQRTKPGAQPLRRPLSTTQRGAIAELPGFGDYLVTTGILTRERLRAAQAYQRSMKVQLSTAIVTLGLATPQRVEWAAVAHQAQLGRER